jgi:hypothetical protein
MRDTILEKLREIEDMFAAVTCDGQSVEEGDTIHWELTTAMNALVERVDYYVD